MGPEAVGMDTVIQGLDLNLGRLIAGLTARDLLDKVNIIVTADEGWSISTRDYYNSNPEANTGGTHGYDPYFLSMHGIFPAYGPAFKDGLIVP